MQLSPSAFNDFLGGIGQSFLWRRSFACPCINPHSGAPSMDCPVCAGKGQTWIDPIPCTAGIVGQSQLKKFAQFGEWNDGDTLLSIPSDSALYAAGVFDRVQAENRSESFSMNMIAGINDRVNFSVVSIERVAWINGTTLVDATIASINPDGTIVWGLNQPPSRTTFSISGRRRPEYYVYMDIPLDRPFHYGAALPRRVVIRRFDLFGR